MDFDRLVAELAEFAVGYTDVAEDTALQPKAPPDLGCLIEPGFLADVRTTLADILELPEEVATRRAPLAAALIVIEMARRHAEIADALDAAATDAILRDGHEYPDDDDEGDSAPGVQLLLLSPLASTTTGVEGAIVWISAGEFLGSDPGLGPRIVVALGDAITTEGIATAPTVTLADTTEVHGDLPEGVIRRAVLFVDRHRDTLLRHWYRQIDVRELPDGFTGV